MDRPILFSGPMVRALLAGTKTQTRRVLNPQPVEPVRVYGEWWDRTLPNAETPLVIRIAVGDRLYVRENFRAEERDDGQDGYRFAADDLFVPIENTVEAAERWSDLFHYAAKRYGRPKGLVGRLMPGMHMPRWASRITLRVTDVRVERLQSISDEDAIAEGIERVDYDGTNSRYIGDFGWKDYRDHPHSVVPFDKNFPARSYETLWTSINGPGSWEANPWVAAYTFEVELQNIDAIAEAA